MEASKITISKSTFELFDPRKIKGRRKTNLRRKLIIEYIESKPAGTVIRLAEFKRAGQFATDGAAHGFIANMIKNGIISRYEADKPKTYYYGVTGSVRTRKLVMAPAAAMPLLPVSLYDQLTPLAKDFVWERGSDSLREFMAYIREKQL